MNMGRLADVVNELANAVRTSQAPDDVVEQVHALADRAVHLLRDHTAPPPYAAEQLSPPAQRTLVWHPEDLRRTIPYSPFLGDLNPIAGRAKVWAEEGAVRGTITLSPVHTGPIGSVHGGVLAALLDELTSLAVMAAGRVGYTRTLTVTYHRPTPVGAELALWAHTAGPSGSVILTAGEIRHGDRLTASVTAVHHAAGSRDDPVYPACDA